MSEQGPPPEPLLENRLPAEGINSSSEHPLREFAWLLTAALSVLLAVTLLIGWGAKWLAPLVPFSAEVALAERVVDHPPKTEQLPRHEALQSLADRLAARMDLPEGMTLMVRFDDSPVVNAYATFGGRIRVFEGLLRELKCEDALAALLAHEIAHVKHRHVAAQMGRGMALSLLLAAVSSEAGAAAAQAALGNAAGLVLMGYSREQEAQADEEALRAVVALYGHAGGVVSLFESLGPASERGPSIEALRSHPLTAARIDAALAGARQAGWPTAGELTALPAALSFTPRR
mgnify:CR=1 FL=1